MLSVTCFTAAAKVTYVYGDFVYEKINDNREFEVDEYTGTSANVVTFRSYISLPITIVGSYAFSGNETMQTITFSSDLKYIDNYAFLNATVLTTVNCKPAVELIGTSAFEGCSSLTSINLEDTSVTEISSYSFFNCTSLVEITLPDTVTSIGDFAFDGCISLDKITIPTSVTSIADTAFRNSDKVVIYCYTDSAAHMYAEENAIEYVLIDQIPAVTYILGDVDNSGEVSILDATEVQLLIAQLVEPMDEYTQLRADIDCDGVLSIMDATSIQMYIAGYEVDEPIGETFEV